MKLHTVLCLLVLLVMVTGDPVRRRRPGTRRRPANRPANLPKLPVRITEEDLKILQDKNKVKHHTDCLVEVKTRGCNANIVARIKSAVRKVILENCRTCGRKEKQNARTFTRQLQQGYPAHYSRVVSYLRNEPR